MKKIVIAISVIFTLVMVSSAFADDIIGKHNLSNNRGLVTVKAIAGKKMTLDVIYVPVKGNLVLLTNVYADFDPNTQRAVYSEDKSCPDALEMKFQNNGKVVLREAACAEF
jgi:hypothetical protein